MGLGTATYSFEYPALGDYDMARIHFRVRLPEGVTSELQPGSYDAIKIVFGNPDVGCGDCEVPACFVVNGLVLESTEGQFATAMDPYSGASWGSYIPGCPFIVPARPSTLGGVKGIYR
jgi:hypothetical protein